MQTTQCLRNIINGQSPTHTAALDRLMAQGAAMLCMTSVLSEHFGMSCAVVEASKSWASVWLRTSGCEGLDLHGPVGCQHRCLRW